MPENEYEESEVTEEPNPVRQQREQIKSLEQQLKEREEELALARANLDLNPKQAKALRAAHEGDWTPEALRETARELGYVPKEEEPSEPVPDEEVARHQQVAEAMVTGGAPAPPTSPDQRLRDVRDRVANSPGNSMEHLNNLREEVMAAIRAHPDLEFGSVDIIP